METRTKPEPILWSVRTSHLGGKCSKNNLFIFLIKHTFSFLQILVFLITGVAFFPSRENSMFVLLKVFCIDIWKCQLPIGTCRLPLQGLNHEWLQLLTFNTLWKEFRVESRNETLCALGKTGRTGLWMAIFRRRFYERNSFSSCI